MSSDQDPSTSYTSVDSYVDRRPTSIEDLPSELLIPVFFEVMQSTVEIWFDSLHNLAQVSRSWAEVVLGSPQLWTAVTEEGPEVAWKSALRLSKSGPIDVHIGYDCSSQIVAAATTLENMRRWWTAKLILPPYHTPGDLHLNSQIQRSEAHVPLLRHLEISASYEYVLDPFPGGARNLRHFTLRGTTLRDWSSPLLLESNLSRLSLVNINVGPTVQQCFTILRHLPKLEKLLLHFVTFSNRTHVTSSNAYDQTSTALTGRAPYLALRDLDLARLLPYAAMLDMIMFFRQTASESGMPSLHRLSYSPYARGLSPETETELWNAGVELYFCALNRRKEAAAHGKLPRITVVASRRRRGLKLCVACAVEGECLRLDLPNDPSALKSILVAARQSLATPAGLVLPPPLDSPVLDHRVALRITPDIPNISLAVTANRNLVRWITTLEVVGRRRKENVPFLDKISTTPYLLPSLESLVLDVTGARTWEALVRFARRRRFAWLDGVVEARTSTSTTIRAFWEPRAEGVPRSGRDAIGRVLERRGFFESNLYNN